MGNKLKKWTEIIALSVVAGICLVQVIYAIVWAVSNGNNVQDFYDTAIYLDSALTMKSDGWRLIGYSCFLKMFLPMEENYAVPVYLMQCIISLLCYAQMVRSCSRFFGGVQVSFYKALIVAVYIITIPIIWQMQFSVLPDALCLSFAVLLCSGLLECWNSEEKVSPWVWVMIGVSLFVLGILERHYFYGGCIITGVSLLARLLCFLKKKNRNRRNGIVLMGWLLILLVVPALVCATWKLTQTDGEYATYSIESDLWKRFVYPNIAEDYPFYPETVRELLSEDDVITYAGRYEDYMSQLLPKLESSGKENAETLCWDMVKTGWSVHKDELVEQSAKESISYMFIPVAMIKYMYNNANSLYGYNFNRMYEVNPRLTADYMHVGMNGFLGVCVLGMSMVCIQVLTHKNVRKSMGATVIYSIVTACCITLPMMIFSFARFDYRIGLFSTFIWGMVSVLAILFPILRNRNKGE